MKNPPTNPEAPFYDCTGLASVTIPGSVIYIGPNSFAGCTNLNSVVVGSGVTSIGGSALEFCFNLTGVYFKGNAPSLGDSHVFFDDYKLAIDFLPGKTGWGDIFGGNPTAQWRPQVPGDTSFGVRSNQFGFNINWVNASGMVTVIEACTNLTDSSWTGLQTNTLFGDSLYYSDPQWTNYPRRFYRVTSP